MAKIRRAKSAAFKRACASGPAFVLGLIADAPAHSQTTVNVVTSSEDAFGQRIGLEQIGLYNESQARGFSLQQAGNYRIDGAYFVAASRPTNPVIGGATTRVGINALSADFPAPSGIVEYHLALPGKGSGGLVEGGLLEFGGPYLNLSGYTSNADGRWGIRAGFQGQFDQNFGDDQPARQYQGGLVGAFTPDETASVHAFASLGFVKYPGDYAFRPNGTALPPVVRFPQRYPSSWGRWRVMSPTGGAVARKRIGNWDFQASTFYSEVRRDPNDFTILTVDERGIGDAVGIYTHDSVGTALSSEIKAGLRIGKRSRIYGMVRRRRSTDDIVAGDAIGLGPIDTAFPTPITPAPVVGEPRISLDRTRQFTAGIGYQWQATDRLLLRAELLDTRYRKTVTPPDQPASSNTTTATLYAASAAYTAGPRWTLFATTTKGLEESGAAPSAAANRYEILPAVTATQYELGVRTRIGSGPSIIGSLFQIEKDVPAFDAFNRYRLIATARHRGAELSLSGRVTRDLSLLMGAVVLDPKLSGDALPAGLVSRRSPGVSSVLALASFNYDVPMLKGLSIDGQLNYTGTKLIRSTDTLETDDYVLLNAGARYRFVVAGRTVTTRFLATNLLDAREWIGTTSGLILRTTPRAARLTAAVNF